MTITRVVNFFITFFFLKKKTFSEELDYNFFVERF